MPTLCTVLTRALWRAGRGQLDLRGLQQAGAPSPPPSSRPNLAFLGTPGYLLRGTPGYLAGRAVGPGVARCRE
eukprot:2368981-Rhodomonas_salina.1